MKRNKTIALVLALVMMLTLFAGCGQKTSDTQTADDGQTE